MNLFDRLGSLLRGKSDATDPFSLIRLQTSGWTIEVEGPEYYAWTNGAGDVMSLHFFDLRPDIPGPPDKILELRAFYREQVAAVGGALVEVVNANLAGVAAVRVVFKVPQEPTGMTYVGSLTIPFASKSYVIKFQCAETGMTGMRDTAVAAQKMEFDSETGEPINWMRDPYDPSFSAPLLSNPSDDAEWDSMFPEHPLSRLRRYLRVLPSSVAIAERLRAEPPFEGPP